MDPRDSGEETLLELQRLGLAAPGVDLEAALADLADGVPPRLALAGPGQGPVGVRLVRVEGRDLQERLVAIARVRWPPMPPTPEPTLAWQRLANDLQRSTGKTLELALRWDGYRTHGWWMANIVIDGRERGGFNVDVAETPERTLASVADRLCEGWLHEEVWGGWPLCSRHPDRPMWATLGATGRAVWRCETDGADQIEIGRLALDEE